MRTALPGRLLWLPVVCSPQVLPKPYIQQFKLSSWHHILSFIDVCCRAADLFMEGHETAEFEGPDACLHWYVHRKVIKNMHVLLDAEVSRAGLPSSHRGTVEPAAASSASTALGHVTNEQRL
jgi:hypothetical protein